MNDLSPKYSFPALLSLNKLSDMFTALQKSSIPDKFTFRFFSQLGFSSSNDRGFIKVLVFLGFLNEDNSPTSYYLFLRDPSTFNNALMSRILESYKEVYSINSEFHALDFINQKGIFSRLTGHDEKGVIAITKTFRELFNLADVTNVTNITPVSRGSTPSRVSVSDSKGTNVSEETVKNVSEDVSKGFSAYSPTPELSPSSNIGMTLNITINLPATNDSSIYDSIFKSIKDNLK